MAKALVTAPLGLPPAHLLSCEPADPFCRLQDLARGHWGWSTLENELRREFCGHLTVLDEDKGQDQGPE